MDDIVVVLQCNLVEERTSMLVTICLVQGCNTWFPRIRSRYSNFMSVVGSVEKVHVKPNNNKYIIIIFRMLWCRHHDKSHCNFARLHPLHLMNSAKLLITLRQSQPTLGCYRPHWQSPFSVAESKSCCESRKQSWLRHCSNAVCRSNTQAVHGGFRAC